MLPQHTEFLFPQPLPQCLVSHFSFTCKYSRVLKHNIGVLHCPIGISANSHGKIWSNEAMLCRGSGAAPSIRSALRHYSVNYTDMIDLSNPITRRKRCSFKVHIKLQFGDYFLISRLIVASCRFALPNVIPALSIKAATSGLSITARPTCKSYGNTPFT